MKQTQLITLASQWGALITTLGVSSVLHAYHRKSNSEDIKLPALSMCVLCFPPRSRMTLPDDMSADPEEAEHSSGRWSPTKSAM